MIYLGWPELARPSEPLDNCASFEIGYVVFPFPRVVLACNGLDKTTFNGGCEVFLVLGSSTHLPHVVPWNVSLLDESFCSLHCRWSGWCYHNQDNLWKSTPQTLFFGFHLSLGLLLVFSSGIGDKVFFCFRKLLSLVVAPTDVFVNFDFPRKLLSNEFSLSRFFLHTHLPFFSSKVAIRFLSSFIIWSRSSNSAFSSTILSIFAG